MDRVPLQEWLSKPGLLYGLFKGFVCSSVLISFRSIWFSFELKNKLCLVFVLFSCFLVNLSLERKQWINKNAMCLWYCGFFVLCCIRVWYNGDSSLQEYDCYVDIFRYRNIVSGGLSGFFGLLMLTRSLRVHWLGSYLWQQRGWGIEVTQWWIMLWRWNGLGVISHSVVLNIDEKAILVFW